MKHFNSLLIALFIMLSQLIFAQLSTENFEDEAVGSTSFTNNGVIFNILSHSSTFDVYYLANGGWNGTAIDTRFIDNSGTIGAGASFSIKTTSNLFKVNRFWIYAGNNFTNPNATGTLTITGKLSGITKFTQTKTTGFTTNTGITNGYTLIDLTNLNGMNYSNIVIDQLQITAGGDFQYLALDALTWVKDSSLVESSLQISSEITDVSCNGGSNGTISLSVDGGTAPYTYLWSNGATSSSITELTAGSYSVTVRDSSGEQTVVNNLNVHQPSILTTTSSTTATSCGYDNGSITVNPSGGAGGFTYLWSNGATTQTVNELAAGNYSVTITDINACTITRNFVINASDSAPAPAIKLGFRNGDQLSVFETIGEGIKWYASKEDATQRINAIPSTTSILNNTTYYATQTIEGCESKETLAINAQSETLDNSELTANASFKLYPNPTSDILKISTLNKINKVILSDYNGRKVLEKAPNSRNEIDVNSLSKGVYIIKIFTDKEVKTMKFIKD